MADIKKPKIELRNIDDVHPYNLNVKTHDDEQVARIARSLQEFGWDQPIVVDKNGVIIKGHGRRLAAISLGMKQVPVWVRDDLTDEQVRASRLADNRVAISNIDTDLLQKELASLSFDLDGIFDKKELNFVVADMGELNEDGFVQDLDAALAVQTEETAKLVEKVAVAPVKIDKALGFKAISGKDERHVATFMALIEEDTGKTGADAFIEFVKAFSGVDKSVVTE